jgi:hypothetical protein
MKDAEKGIIPALGKREDSAALPAAIHAFTRYGKRLWSRMVVLLFGGFGLIEGECVTHQSYDGCFLQTYE